MPQSHELAQHEHQHGQDGRRLDTQLMMELNVAALLDSLAQHFDDSPPAVQRITLTVTNPSDNNYRGNPVNWSLWRARTVAVWNPNIFPVYVGHGAGAGQAGARTVTVPALTLAILPLESDVYSVGADAASLGAADFDVTVWRFHQPLPPALFEIGTDGSSPSGAADDGSNPVKIGGVFKQTRPTLADGQRGDVGLLANGALMAGIFDASALTGGARVLTAAGDGLGATTSLVVFATQAVSNGVTWDKQRTAAVFKEVQNVAFVAGTPQAVWTPAAGKKFRLMGWCLSLSVAGQILFKEAGAEFSRTPALAAGVGLASPPMGNGQLATTANDALQLDVSAGGNVNGFVFGTEE